MLDDVDELWQQLYQSVSIARRRDILFDGMEVPQGGVRRVVQTFVFAFRKHVRYQPVFDVVSECAENVSRLLIPACR